MDRDELIARPTHSIKCWPGVFEEMLAGRKTSEFRLNDRNFQTGDILLIREWRPDKREYTHREISRRITHVLDAGFGMPSGYAMLSLATDTTPSRDEEGSVDREAIARIIDPDAFKRKAETVAGRNPGWAVEDVQARCSDAMDKADAILVLKTSTPETRTTEQIAESANCSVPVEGGEQ